MNHITYVKLHGEANAEPPEPDGREEAVRKEKLLGRLSHVCETKKLGLDEGPKCLGGLVRVRRLRHALHCF